MRVDCENVCRPAPESVGGQVRWRWRRERVRFLPSQRAVLVIERLSRPEQGSHNHSSETRARRASIALAHA